MSTSSYERIWSVVRRIPRGRVATYGQVARIAGLPRQARMVGYALHALSTDAAKRGDAAKSVPWQRVINAQGRVSLRAFEGSEAVQRKWLEREGVSFDAKARVDLERFGWKAGGEKRITSGSKRSASGSKRSAQRGEAARSSGGARPSARRFPQDRSGA